MLIVNADDWGRDRETTARILECVQCGAVSSVSAMVFMEDSERAAAIAREKGIDAGLHLNLTTSFSAAKVPARLVECQQRISAYLQGNPFARGIFHPGLARAFKYVVEAEREEYARLYGAPPDRIDGHHHMHLCSNVLLGGLLPSGTLVRRHFSYEPREKALRNLVFRKLTDLMLARRYRVVDRLYSLPPLEPPSRLLGFFSLAREFAVELETHPVNPEEYRFLAGGEILRWAGDGRIAPRFAVP